MSSFLGENRLLILSGGIAENVSYQELENLLTFNIYE